MQMENRSQTSPRREFGLNFLKERFAKYSKMYLIYRYILLFFSTENFSPKACQLELEQGFTLKPEMLSEYLKKPESVNFLFVL